MHGNGCRRAQMGLDWVGWRWMTWMGDGSGDVALVDRHSAPVLLATRLAVHRKRLTWGQESVTWETLAVDDGWGPYTAVGGSGARSVSVDGVCGVGGLGEVRTWFPMRLRRPRVRKWAWSRGVVATVVVVVVVDSKDCC
jgi:hypothetical protein